MRLIITRHGETIENTKGIMQGHLPGHLTEKGKIQAKKISERFKEEKIDIFFSSDLKRAKDTTKYIYKYHKNKPLIYTYQLREKDLGELTGKYKKEYNWDIKSYKFVTYENKEGEQNKDFLKRTKDFLLSLRKHKNKTILIVCHNGIARALISIIKNKKYNNKITSFNNNNIFIFDFNIENKKINLNKEKRIAV
jgi:alpha-ribazole phosphatase